MKCGDDYLQCLVYADDLAICSNNLCAIQQSIDRLYKYCSDNYLGINIGKTKIMKFRRGGHLAKSDVITCNSNPIEFVSKFTYLGVVFQTKGTLTGHFEHLRNKGIAACAKVAARMPLSKMSPAILARLFLAVVLPSATYGLSSIHTNETLDFLDEVQGRLIKAWFGVSKLRTVLPLHLELLLGGAKHLNFISPPLPNPSVYSIPYFQAPARSFEA